MKRQLLSLTMLIAFTFGISAQTQPKPVACDIAAGQLINYANQVKAFYDTEYFLAIPTTRCPAYWNGQPVPWQMVQNCQYQHVVWLNQWFGQQTAYMNNWQNQILNTCFTKRPKVDPIGEQVGKIDTDQLEEIQAGVDEDKAIRITIPKTAEGYKPRGNQ